jgi:hypothetical protein
MARTLRSSRLPAAVIGIAALAALALSGPPARSAQTQARPLPVFGPDSVWRRPLGRHARIDPLSALYVRRLARTAAGGAWINTTEYSTPVYRVPARQPGVRVTLDQPRGVNADLRRALARVPIPAGARPAAGTDGNLVVWQPATDTLWELWGARRARDGWHARHGGRMTDLSQSPGYFPRNQGWGASATGLPLLGGLIRIAEVRAGRIDHAVSIALPETRAGIFAWPAQRTDGNSHDLLALPEGTRLRLDPELDLSRLRMPRLVRLIARAAQRYGLIVTDRAANVAFFAEDPSPLGRNPYWPGPRKIFGGEYPDRLLQSFPWERLQVVRAPQRSG